MPVLANGSIWVSSNAGGTLVRVDPAKNKVVNETPGGPMPRFLTVGAGSIWVLNQGGFHKLAHYVILLAT